MKNRLLIAFVFLISQVVVYAQGTGFEYKISLKSPGNPAETYALHENAMSELLSTESIPIEINQKRTDNGETIKIEVILKANERVYYNFEQIYKIPSFKHSDSEFFMPGFWYHKNMRSPKEAPSFATSDSWQVREDRLSTPLTGIYNEKTGEYYTVIRLDKFENESLSAHSAGEVILTDKTSLGFTGFRNVNGISSLVFGFPYSEAPKTYIRKLTLAPAVQAFEKLEKNETRHLVWEIKKG